jgi:hypothetical protein
MKVVLATDGSPSAENAIRWFCHLPIPKSNSLEILTVSSYQAYDLSVVESYNEYCLLVRKNAIAW